MQECPPLGQRKHFIHFRTLKPLRTPGDPGSPTPAHLLRLAAPQPQPWGAPRGCCPQPSTAFMTSITAVGWRLMGPSGSPFQVGGRRFSHCHQLP